MNVLENSEDLKKVRSMVNLLKEEKDLSQEEVGQLVGYSSKTAFSSVLNGHKPLPKDLVLRLESITQKENMQANVFGNNHKNDGDVIKRLIESYEKQLNAKDEQINKLIEKIK